MTHLSFVYIYRRVTSKLLHEHLCAIYRIAIELRVVPATLSMIERYRYCFFAVEGRLFYALIA